MAAPHGIIAVAWTHAAVSLGDTFLRLVVARHFIGVTFRDIGRQMLPAYRAGVALAVAAQAMAWATSGFGDLLSLVATTVVGGTVYLGVLARFSRADLRRILGWVGLGRFVRQPEAS